MRLGVFAVLIYLAISYLNNSSSNLKVPNFDPKVLGAFSPQIEQGQKYINLQFFKLKEQALDQFFDHLKRSILK